MTSRVLGVKVLRSQILLAAAFTAQGALAQSGVKWVPLNGAPTSHSARHSTPAKGSTIPAQSRVAAAAPQAMPVPNAPAGATSPIPEDLALLQGKKVVVGRIALCIPNTFQPNLKHAGETATVVEFKPNRTLDNVQIGRMPANARAMIENIKKGGLLVLQFQDGTKLDTCAPQGSNQLSPNLDLAPGEMIAVSAGSNPTSAASIDSAVFSAPSATQTSAKQPCPMAVIKVSPGNSFGHLLVDVLTTSELQRQIDQVNHGGVQKHYLDVKVRNDSGKPVKAFEFSAAYADRMGDESTATSFVSQNDKSIRAGEVYKAFAMDRDSLMQNGKGEVTVFVGRVRFEDNSQWQDNGSRSCGLKASFR